MLDTTFDQSIPKNTAGVLKEQIIQIVFKDEEGKEKKLLLRKEVFRDVQNRVYEFITNNFTICREEVALLYKIRRNIELLFKQLQQNFQLHYFYSDTENGIKTQIWCTHIAQLLLQVIRVKSQSKKAFSTIAALIRIHFIGHLEVFWMVASCRRNYVKKEQIAFYTNFIILTS